MRWPGDGGEHGGAAVYQGRHRVRRVQRYLQIAGTILVADLTHHAYAAAMATLAVAGLAALATATRLPRTTPTANAPADAPTRPRT